MKKKFVTETKINQTVYHIELNIRDDNSLYNQTSLNPHGLFVSKLKIVYQSKFKIALNNEWITCLDRERINVRKDDYHHYLEDISVRIISNERYFANGIFASMYTLNDPSKQINKIKKSIQNKINKDYGFLRFCNIEQVIDSFNLENKLNE